ncbi:hypothetical protein ACLKA6_005069 [Drosophila palustris]
MLNTVAAKPQKLANKKLRSNDKRQLSNIVALALATCCEQLFKGCCGQAQSFEHVLHSQLAATTPET